MRPLVIETDLGHDPDDFFAICYLSYVADIRAILLTPGHAHQVAIAEYLIAELGLDAKVGIPSFRLGQGRGDDRSWSGFHVEMLKKAGHQISAEARHGSDDLLDDVFREDSGAELFICGPLKNVGPYLDAHPGLKISRATMQGGFIGYDVHGMDVERLEKFEGKNFVNIFNLSSYAPGGEALLAADVADRRFVSKNVCQTLTYDRTVHETVKAVPPKGRGVELIREGMDLYLSHKDGKKFYDPTAAVAHAHPEIVTWYHGCLCRNHRNWGTKPEPKKDRISVDINRKALWCHIANGD